MTGIFAARVNVGKPLCARCHRPFTPKHEGDRYGPTCAMKVGAKPDPECQVDCNSRCANSTKAAL